MRADQQWTCEGAIIRGVWAPPKLLAEAKSDENERTEAESWGSNTPWAYRPGEFESDRRHVEISVKETGVLEDSR